MFVPSDAAWIDLDKIEESSLCIEIPDKRFCFWMRFFVKLSNRLECLVVRVKMSWQSLGTDLHQNARFLVCDVADESTSRCQELGTPSRQDILLILLHWPNNLYIHSVLKVDVFLQLGVKTCLV